MKKYLVRSMSWLAVLSAFYMNSLYAHSSSPSVVGQPADASRVTKTIKVTASDDMKFQFLSEPNLHNGDVISFEVTNVGKVPHEFSIGDEKEQKAHLQMMRKMPNMVHQHGNAITINPGETKQLIWEFKSGFEVVFACNIPGHFEAGMYKKAHVA
ncbi:hypothetical protein E3983_03825 [Legionella israelensis]|uniref:Copper-binding protein n=1 Tax=Legionella israelensis TaxID=454 RepID=A0A0W0VMY8_9GAMM|nr:hypothetical protein [Legionella israelensis]KTD21438.1 hypothetical protein Lisr_1547 [Legionella israelensis]QBR83563.1 hypothetical protein E3983_03825 [Legionella israelensis]QBS09045.1 hypothetical protein E4T55_03765 [Legionella israelensis]QDP72108.1 hypothetical protein FOG18_05760 [Legionella israelensis]SCY50579.1 Uncharacterized copper-binding protein, cupredoxin-like subfamily [Legionella israelensis DSM 19235]